MMPQTCIESRRLYRLSRYLQFYCTPDGFVIESLMTGRRKLLPNTASLRVLLSLTEPAELGSLIDRVDFAQREKLIEFFDQCLESGLITDLTADGVATEDTVASIGGWERHDLAFHLRSRRGRTDAPVGATWHLANAVPAMPARGKREPEHSPPIRLAVPDLRRLKDEDWPLTRVLESRRTRYSTAPISVDSLGELLFRACRVTQQIDVQGEELVRRVYPSGGSRHSLDIYLVVHRCHGLPAGGYRYDAFEHELHGFRPPDQDQHALLREAQAATGVLKDLPSVLLIVASRIHRVTRKYQSNAYRLVLQEVGALYQTIYLVGEALGLSVCALGAGNSERFAQAFGRDFFSEPSVGEMILGGEACPD